MARPSGRRSVIAVGIWIGYDNADGKRRTLGDGQTGGQVAVPIFEPIIEATWANYARKTPLYPPSPEAAKELVALPIDLNSGTRLWQRQTRAFIEYFRLKHGQLSDTQYLLVSPNEMVAARDPGDGEMFMRGSGGGDYGRGYYPSQGSYYKGGSNSRGFFQGGFIEEMRPRYWEDRRWAPPPRVDPNGSWRDRQRGYW